MPDVGGDSTEEEEMEENRELMHINNMDLIDFEQGYLKLGVDTLASRGKGLSVALTLEDLEELTRMLDTSAGSKALNKLESFVAAALKWAWHNRDKMGPTDG